MSSTSNVPNLTPIDLSKHQSKQKESASLLSRLNLRDVAFALLTIALFTYGALKNLQLMDIYEKVILVFSVASIIALGWFWRPLQWVFGWVALISLGAVAMYAGNLARGETVFGLKYMFASQPLVMLIFDRAHPAPIGRMRLPAARA